MSFVIAAPGTVAAAASDIAGIASTLHSANTVAAASTTRVVAAAGDEVSTAIARLFGTYALDYHALSAQAATFHAQFVSALSAGAQAYSTAEAANVSPLQTLEDDLLGLINAPTNFLLGRPLIGDGFNGTTNAQGVGTAGGGGGLLIGNGGKGGDSIATGWPAGPAVRPDC